MGDILNIRSVIPCDSHPWHTIRTSYRTCTSIHSESGLWSKHLDHVCCHKGIRGGRTPEQLVWLETRVCVWEQFLACAFRRFIKLIIEIHILMLSGWWDWRRILHGVIIWSFLDLLQITWYLHSKTVFFQLFCLDWKVSLKVSSLLTTYWLNHETLSLQF